jgi:hypothetical protein
MRRAFSRCRTSSRCSVVGLDVNVVGGFGALSLCLSCHRASSCRRASSRHSIVVFVVVVVVVVVIGLDVDVVGGFEASSTSFVLPPRLLPPLHCCRRHCLHPCHNCHCHRLCRHRHRPPCHRSCRRCHCRRRWRRCWHLSSSSLLSCHHRCRCCRRNCVWLIVVFAVAPHLLPPSPLPIASTTTQCRCLVILCCIAPADTSLIALPPLLLRLFRAGWLLHCQHVAINKTTQHMTWKKTIKSCNVGNMLAMMS